MKFKLYTDAALALDVSKVEFWFGVGRELSARALCRGDVVKLVDHHIAPDGQEGYSVEVFNALGETIAVTTVPEAALESLRSDEVLSVRPLSSAA